MAAASRKPPGRVRRAREADVAPPRPEPLATVLEGLLDPYVYGRMRATAVVEAALRRGAEGVAEVMEELARKEPGVRGALTRVVAHLLAAARCVLCRELPERLSWNVDEETPPAAARLTTLVWCRASRPGLDGYGLSLCRECGSVYSRDRDLSMTGSQMNDYERLSRLDVDEAELLRPLVEAWRSGSDDVELKVCTEELVLTLEETACPGGSDATRLCSALVKLLASDSASRWLDLLRDHLLRLLDADAMRPVVLEACRQVTPASRKGRVPAVLEAAARET